MVILCSPLQWRAHLAQLTFLVSSPHCMPRIITHHLVMSTDDPCPATAAASVTTPSAVESATGTGIAVTCATGYSTTGTATCNVDNSWTLPDCTGACVMGGVVIWCVGVLSHAHRSTTAKSITSCPTITVQHLQSLTLTDDKLTQPHSITLVH